MVRRWVSALVLGGMWWWAVLRLVLVPAHAGFVEGAVAAGGWGLSLLPVHAAATAGSAAAGAGAARWSAVGVRWAGRWAGPWMAAGSRCAERGWRATTAWLRRHWGGGSGRS
ncbi:hypothetical protein [Streptomyces sp. NPDC088260]|uniref:hypothetical protein n=1 Tax=Streptomyces sp. NPDC088260 TaxID=3365850 RepID=UPI003819FA48